MTQKQFLIRFTGAEELELYEFLRKESFETGLPMAEIMRRGLELYKNQKGATTMTNKIDFGTVVFEGKEYALQAHAEPTSRLLPDHLAGHFEMTAPAIGLEDDQGYLITWIFEDDGRDLDQYDYDEVFNVELGDFPVYLVQMVRGTENSWDETHEGETVFRTLNLKEAEEVKCATDKIITNNFDLDGNPYFLAPAIIRIWGDDETLID